MIDSTLDVKYCFMYPPRPENAVSPTMLDFYEKRNWVATLKKNGTCSEIIVPPNKDLMLFTRHNEPHKAWKPDFKSPSLRKFLDLPNEWFTFVGELLHSKGTGHKDTLYLFDIIVANSSPLWGVTFEDRQKLLFSLWPITKDEQVSHCEVDERLWLSKSITGNFSNIFKNLTDPEDEGLVLKNPHATLEICGRQSNNQSWQVKCRKSAANYNH